MGTLGYACTTRLPEHCGILKRCWKKLEDVAGKKNICTTLLNLLQQ